MGLMLQKLLMSYLRTFYFYFLLVCSNVIYNVLQSFKKARFFYFIIYLK